MKYAIEAYDLLVEQLQKEKQELYDRLDEECGTNAVIVCGLLKYINEKLSLQHAIEIAKFFDDQYPEEQLVRYVKEDIGGKYD
jgi:hypothetical protein